MADRRTPQPPLPRAAGRRRKKSGRGRWIAAVLAVCLLIGGCFVLREFLVFTPEGVRFSLPWLETGEEEVAAAPVRPLTGQLKPEPEKAVSIDRGELPPATRGHLRGMELVVSGKNREDMEAAAAELKAEGCTAAVVPVKPSDGPAATREELALAAEVCRDARLRFVAYVSCFRDDFTARQLPELGLKNGDGDLFIDFHYCAWLDPSDPAAQEMILENCRLAEESGAELLLLDALSYPYEGNLDSIDYGRNPPVPREAITDFAAALDEALTVPLGAVIGGDDTLGEGASELRGQDVTVFAACFDSLWTEAADLREARSQRRRAAELTDAEFGVCMDGVWMESVWLNL